MERQLIAALAAVALVAGCATRQPATAPASFVDQQQYTKAMRDNSSAFTWPEGRTPDLTVLAERSGPGPDEAPAGSERIVLEITNSCAWYLGWEDARKRGDQSAATAALKVMDEVLPRFSPEDPDGQRYARETAAKAKAGDGSLAADYVANNCESLVWK
ncbi:hypothetical protein SK803_05170 [Lentzea sp. BCCO 10_0856]|uniref:Lipoprotein n=1 Tax=Lentzea miocenica TaxID=3095431 RepID=A0ABU4SUV4_9PSEU|nr:hypothetical protein [Lentzea sp. BCCO 10_0856]MDX8029589.1 hypothetical protein [Lentzea sp. BCCO 10_0856]